MSKTKDNLLFVSMIVLGQLMPHFSVEYRNHFTDFHATVVDMAGGIQIGATEQLLIMYGLQLFFSVQATTNEFVDQPIDFKSRFGFELPFPITGTQLLAVGASFVPAVQYNSANLYIGFTASKDKLYAAFCALPFFQLYLCLILAS